MVGHSPHTAILVPSSHAINPATRKSKKKAKDKFLEIKLEESLNNADIAAQQAGINHIKKVKELELSIKSYKFQIDSLKKGD